MLGNRVVFSESQPLSQAAYTCVQVVKLMHTGCKLVSKQIYVRCKFVARKRLFFCSADLHRAKIRKLTSLQQVNRHLMVVWVRPENVCTLMKLLRKYLKLKKIFSANKSPDFSAPQKFSALDYGFLCLTGDLALLGE